MVHQNNQSELLLAWKALSGSSAIDGWRMINIDADISCKARAARHFPGNQEVLLLGFNNIKKLNDHSFPKGKGFSLSYADLGSISEDLTWISLTRELIGSLDLFSKMSEDILSVLEKIKGSTQQTIFTIILARINAWQDFMKRNKEGVLSSEEEIGLFGELLILRDLTKYNILPSQAIDCWQGPLDSIQDFYLNTGALEVKTTISKNAFDASINSLEQLDNTLVSPLYLIGVKLSLNDEGITLSNLIKEIKNEWAEDAEAIEKLNIKLLHAGFFEELSKEYKRTFTKIEIVTFIIDEQFPKITKPSLHKEITKVKYTVDLDLINANKIDFNLAVSKLREN